MKSIRLLSFLAVVLFSLLVWVYVREFAVLSNTLEVKALVTGSMLVVAALTSGTLWYWRERFTPFERHFPEVVLILVFSVLFAPLFGSLLNRSLGKSENQSFVFVSETAYFASGYGILKGEKLSPTGWRLTVREGTRERRLKYKSQAYFPLSKPGDKILLPVRQGILGARVVQLR
ncbi:MAG: hypothetical protein ACKVU0_10035 [Saprospiraceae bacterium]